MEELFKLCFRSSSNYDAFALFNFFPKHLIGLGLLVAVYIISYPAVFCIWARNRGRIGDAWFRWLGLNAFGRSGRVLAGLLFGLMATILAFYGVRLLFL